MEEVEDENMDQVNCDEEDGGGDTAQDIVNFRQGEEFDGTEDADEDDANRDNDAEFAESLENAILETEPCEVEIQRKPRFNLF